MLGYMLDMLLDILDKEPEFRHFHLDSQTMPVQDYLEVYPEKKEKFQKYVQEGRIGIFLTRSGDMYRVSIEDNGPGVKESDIEKLFSPDFTTKVGGNGLVGRIGGDEFTAILHTDTDNLKQLLDNFAQAAAQWHGNTVQGLSISTGAVAVANEAELTGIDDLVHRADQEMYLSKACFYSFRGNDRRKPRKKYE